MTHTDRRTRRGNLRHLIVTLARLGETRRDATLEIGDDLWGRVPVESGMG